MRKNNNAVEKKIDVLMNIHKASSQNYETFFSLYELREMIAKGLNIKSTDMSDQQTLYAINAFNGKDYIRKYVRQKIRVYGKSLMYYYFPIGGEENTETSKKKDALKRIIETCINKSDEFLKADGKPIRVSKINIDDVIDEQGNPISRELLVTALNFINQNYGDIINITIVSETKTNGKIKFTLKFKSDQKLLEYKGKDVKRLNG